METLRIKFTIQEIVSLLTSDLMLFKVKII